ncbi:MAG: 30S ribosomal protein S16 [Candidatus Nealsonbacteria bacterium]|nr:30S ribosomal protein S16 [Candidatus Nealsonbacteria bacterium]
MLVIRFLRAGKRNQPFYKIVVTDKKNPPRGGRFNEEVGFWNPLTKEKKLNAEKIKTWIKNGAKPSATVFNLLLKEKILDGKKIAVHKKSKKPAEAAAPVVPVATAPAEAPKAEAPKESEVKKEEAKAEESKA